MQIVAILCPEHIEEKLEAKHGVTDREARQVLLGRSRIRFAEKGHTDGVSDIRWEAAIWLYSSSISQLARRPLLSVRVR